MTQVEAFGRRIGLPTQLESSPSEQISNHLPFLNHQVVPDESFHQFSSSADRTDSTDVFATSQNAKDIGSGSEGKFEKVRDQFEIEWNIPWSFTLFNGYSIVNRDLFGPNAMLLSL